MLHTYKAVLRGHHIEWIHARPQSAGAVPVHVTLPEGAGDESAAERGRTMAEALEALAAAGALPDTRDPAAWQRELRRDRSLPGRER